MRALKLLLGLGWLLPALAGAQITIDEYQAGDTVRYPLVALHGTAEGDTIAIGGDWDSAARFPIHNSRWAGCVELKPGPNMIVLQAGRYVLRYKLNYLPMRNPYKVAALFIKAKDGSDAYYTNQLGDKFPIREKLDLAMKFLQSATAEAMNKAGYGRKTFNLETDRDGKVAVHFITLDKSTEEMRSMENGASWAYIYDQLKAKLPETTLRWLGVMGFATFDRTTGKSPGHYALGGGALALFGAASMGWWPVSMKEVPQKLHDPYVLDKSLMFEDSAGRGTAWAQVSTAYGAMLHELGHTFGLPHSPDRWSVMSRGFDHFNRWFMLQDPPSKQSAVAVDFGPDEVMKWDPWFAARLNLSPWFQPDGGLQRPLGLPSIEVQEDQVKLSAPDGIRLWGAERDDLPHVWEQTKGTKMPTSMVLSVAELRRRLGTPKEFRVVLVDGLGQQASVEVKN